VWLPAVICALALGLGLPALSGAETSNWSGSQAGGKSPSIDPIRSLSSKSSDQPKRDPARKRG
jgi:hypothetical protein